jgi:hypothetical protein
LIRKNKKKNEYVLDDSEINQDLITNSYPWGLFRRSNGPTRIDTIVSFTLFSSNSLQ